MESLPATAVAAVYEKWPVNKKNHVLRGSVSTVLTATG